jgi:transcriptional regulator with XRE-family HTH domain
MDDVLVGRGFRALRKRRGWTQRDLSAKAAVPQSTISLVEAGRIEAVSLPTVRKIGRALGMAVELRPSWPISDVAKLLDSEHARLVERVVRHLRVAGWEVVVEYTFNDYGDRGAVDILAWHPGRRALLIVEIKTRIADVQDLHAALDRKSRVVPRPVARERSWRALTIGKLLVVADSDANRARIRSHAETFAVTFPAGSRGVRRWIGDPIGPLAGLWFVRNIALDDRHRANGG